MTKDEVNAALAELVLISPRGSESLFTPVLKAVESYFARTDDLSPVAYDTLKQIVFDGLMSGLEVDRPELLPPLSSEHPRGYSNVTDLISGAFDCIFETDPWDFVEAFTSETVMQGQTGITVWHNPYLETTWLKEIGAARENLEPQLEALSEYCRGRFETWTLPLIFEEFEYVRNRLLKARREFAREIYIRRGWREFLKTLNLSVYMPSYEGELDEDDA